MHIYVCVCIHTIQGVNGHRKCGNKENTHTHTGIPFNHENAGNAATRQREWTLRSSC